MKNFSFKKLVPHLIAVAVFLLVSIIFCKPALESGVILKQSDITGWHGMSHQSFLYNEAHGHFPLWVSSMFSGMPAYQVMISGSWSPVLMLDHAFQLWLPQPMNFFFLACISFYFLCICLRLRPLAAILGALAYAYCSFSPIIITAGHNTQMLALGYAPAVIGACILIFRKKYLAGFTLAALFTSLQIAQGHQQISYYLFIILTFMSVSYIIQLIKQKEIPHLVKSLVLLVVAGLIGVATNAVTLFPTYDYAKESKRGGQLVMDQSSIGKNDKVVNGKTTGLSKEYAFDWSYGQAETMTLMFPGVMGYGNHQAERDGDVYQFPLLDENSNAVKTLTEKLPGVGEQAAGYASSSLYWGKQPFTNGPVYLGAVVCFLFITGMFYLDGKQKWWILAASIFGIMMAWGHNLAGFNYFLFDHFPLYNKFRVPTMALVIPQMLFPIVAAMVMSKIADGDDPDAWKKFRTGAIATGAVFLLALGFYASSNFSNENRLRTNEFNKLYNAQDVNLQQKLYDLGPDYKPSRDNQVYEGMVANFRGAPDAQKSAREFVSALSKDRGSVFLRDIFRSFIFILLAAIAIALYIRKKINATILLAGVSLLLLIDLLSFDSKYLNDKSFDAKDKYEEQEFPMTTADRQILEDKDPNFRVYDRSVGSPFESSKASYYHKSIGGYHAAKMGIYDDLTTYQLPNDNPNVSVLNMLNTKYVIQQQGNDLVAAQNPAALGNVWFVKEIKFVDGPVAEMRALDKFNPRNTVVIDQKYKPLLNNITPADSTASIKMTSFDNDDIKYESNAAGNHVAVFSEIFYKDWEAFIDGKKVEIMKVNYVLRGLAIPAGKHNIEFKFEPSIFYISKNISNIASWLVAILLLATIALEVKARTKK